MTGAFLSSLRAVWRLGRVLKIDVELAVGNPGEAAGLAGRAESLGFDCLWANETKHDPFVLSAVAAGATKKILVGTSIAVAFTRSPTTIAYTAWDLQNLSGGRFILGLGSQVKGHIERRYAMQWESPAPKLGEVVLALRAIWDSWQTGKKLEFKGKFYRIDLMTPFFTPAPIRKPGIPVYLAGVNPGMCRVAGMVADGLHVHPLHTRRYLKEVVRPAVDGGAKKAGRETPSVAVSVFAAVGDDRKGVEAARESLREQVAFYASTRTYKGLMDLHGWGDVSERLHELSLKGEWKQMGAEVGDDVLDEFVVEGTWDQVGKMLVDRYEGLADRVRLYLPFDGGDGWRKVVEGVKA
jgi:probable F420-dependent oxidoreductase